MNEMPRKVLLRVQLSQDALKRLQAAAETDIRATADEKELIDSIDDCDALICTGPERLYTDAVFKSAPRLRIVARVSAGVDMLDVEAATARGILVANSPGLNAPAVAEQAVLLILAVTRGLVKCDGMVRGRENFRNPTVFETLRSPEIGGKLLGLIGYGAVGQNLAQRARALGMRVCAYKPARDDALMHRQGVAPVNFDTLLTTSDYVALCCPLTEETRAMIDRNTLKKMKHGSYLINIARGGLIVSEDLAEALAAGYIAGAALDATTPEPPADDDPLLNSKNVIFGAHQGGNTHEAWVRMCERAVDNTLEVLADRYPPHLVNPDALTAYAERFGPLKTES